MLKKLLLYLFVSMSSERKIKRIQLQHKHFYTLLLLSTKSCQRYSWSKKPAGKGFRSSRTCQMKRL